MTKLRFIFGITLLASLFLFVPPASAHRPDQGNEGDMTEISSPTTSFAYYRELVAGGQVQVYRFEAEAGQFFHAGINIPQIDRLENYGVTLALIGPGLPTLPDGRLEAMADHSHEDSGGAESHDHRGLLLMDVLPASAANLGGVVLPSARSPEFFEPFTQTRYWGRQTLEMNVPVSGVYYLMVWNPEGATGKYVLDTGIEEVFGAADLLRFPIWWLQTRLYFEQLPQLVVAGLIILAVLAAIAWLRRRRGSPFHQLEPRPVP